MHEEVLEQNKRETGTAHCGWWEDRQEVKRDRQAFKPFLKTIQPQICFSLKALKEGTFMFSLVSEEMNMLKMFIHDSLYSSQSSWWNQSRFTCYLYYYQVVECSYTLTNRETRAQSAPPLVCTPSPWWLWWAVWLSVWWALRSVSHTAPRGKLRTPHHSPETAQTHTIRIWVMHTKHMKYVWEELNQLINQYFDNCWSHF